VLIADIDAPPNASVDAVDAVLHARAGVDPPLADEHRLVDPRVALVAGLRTIIDELDFAYWWPTEIGSESTSEVWFSEELRSRSRSPPVAAGALTSARQPWGSSVTQTATAPPTHELAPLEHAPLPAYCELHYGTRKLSAAIVSTYLRFSHSFCASQPFFSLTL
jgi:hypothetical protein